MKIALTYTGSEEKHLNYMRWLRGGDEIEIVTLSEEAANLDDLLHCDALVMSGGVDVHPSFYDKKKEYAHAPGKFNKKRDKFEIAAFLQSQERQIPLLAVCRGMQLVNCILGGDLVQDLGSKGNAIHRATDAGDKAHGATVEPDTQMASILGTRRIVVNSAHHQCVRHVGDGLKINCTADDGTPEGWEWEEPAGKSFLLGVQWHPERMFRFGLDATAPAMALRQHFMEAIIQSKKK